MAFDRNLLPSAPGTYALVLYLDETQRFVVGGTGDQSFPAGNYVYVGSALGGLWQRVGRHMRQDRRTRWHIDYLLDHMALQEIWYAVGDERRECSWARALAAAPGAEPWGRLGASDCRCATHVFRIDEHSDVGDVLIRVLPAGVDHVRVQDHQVGTR